ncbi:MAG TPA: tetratricopeptide repeat protein [Acetobacteraceae bacterium]|nr:tetratricopeptide repeat protein [Acetobacteraceae bacterium]
MQSIRNVPTVPPPFVMPTDLQHAIALHQRGQLAAAERAYRDVLRQDPTNANAWHLLGIVALQSGHPEPAAALIARSIELDDRVAGAFNNRAIALRRLGRRDEALASLDSAIALEPGNAEAHNNRGSLLRELARPSEALQSLDSAIALQPDYADAYNNKGILLRQLGRIDEALTSYEAALSHHPNSAETHLNRGNALSDLGRLHDALASYDAAIALNARYTEAHASRGNILLRLQRPADAIASYDKAIAINPNFAAAHADKGNALRRLARPDEALASYDHAIALNPADPSSLFSRGDLLRSENRTDEAVASLRAAVAANPLHGAARLAACMAELPILYHTAEELPLRRQRYLAALDHLQSAVAEPAIAASVAADIGTPPFYLPYQGENDVAPQSMYGRLACRLLAEAHPPARLAPRPSAGERIRLGIVSGFFRNHTVFKLFLEGWLSQLDRSRFEIIAFHTSPLSDAVTTRAAALCDRFVQGLTTKPAWRDAIIDAKPHALLYPEVGMDAMVGWLAAQRLAPLQCIAWGHPETTGMPTIDYVLSSALMEPPDADDHYTERLVQLPGLGIHYTPDDPPPPPLDHAAFGLEPDQPLFWTGQSLYKYLPQHDWIYPRIARAVGPCRFVFITTLSAALTEAFRKRIGSAFAQAGLNAEDHCTILPNMPHERYVALAGLADVMLDPPDWSGGKSTLDCLTQSPAIVTLPGRFMRQRHTAAILRRIGCETTIAATPDEYVAIAARLVQDAAFRSQVKQAVAERQHHAYRDLAPIAALEAFLTEAVTQR